jgi:peptide chain release factor 3
VLASRLAGEYGTQITFEQTPYSLARWVSGEKTALANFIAGQRSAMADDVDGDPVFLASSAFMMRRAVEGHTSLQFRDIKDVRPEAA